MTGSSLGEHQIFDLERDTEMIWSWNSEGESLLSLSLQQQRLLSCSRSLIQLWEFDRSQVQLKKSIGESLENMQLAWTSSQ